MNQIEDKIVFSGVGMDTDSDILAIKKGASRYRLNVIEKFGDMGVLVSIKGNDLMSGSLPSGDNNVIGFVEDGENGWGIFFVHNTLGSHSIMYSDGYSMAYILDGTDGGGSVGATLNFAGYGYIDAGIIGNEDDRYLVWTDGINEPRILNIPMALNYTAGSGTPIYTSISSDVLSFYKKPLMSNMTVTYGQDAGELNNVIGRLWQFAVRIKYYDNTYSVLSPYSSVAIPANQENVHGVFYFDSSYNNKISISFSRPDNYEIISEYQLCYRTVDSGSGTPSPWYLSDIEPTGTTTQTFVFRNKNNGVILSDEDTSRFYDYIPDLANHLFVIDSNRVVFGGITEGRDNLESSDLDVSFSVARTGNVSSNLEYDFFQSVSNTATSSAISTSKTTSYDYHYSVIVDVTGGSTYAFQYVNTKDVTGADVAIYLSGKINALSGISSTPTASSFTVTNNTGSTISVEMKVYSQKSVYKSFKCGSTNYFGIQYFKDGKPWFIQRNDSFNVDIPYQYEAPNTNEFTGTHAGSNNSGYLEVATSTFTASALVGAVVYNVTDGSAGIILANTATTVIATLVGGTDNDWDIGDSFTISFEYFNFYNKISWEVDHLPPQDATHWQWVYLGNNYDYYEYYFIKSSLMVEDGNYTVIDKDFITFFKNGHSDSINYGFDIQKGDRIRFIGILLVGLSLNMDLYDSLYDFEILDVDALSIKISNITSILSDIGSLPIVEIYRPRIINEESGTYQAVSPVMETYNDSGTIRHKGVTRDQTSSLSATGTFDPYFSNCFVSGISYVNTNNFSDWDVATIGVSISEVYSASLLYDSSVLDFGKRNVVNKFSEEKYLNKIRFGGKFLDNSGVNFMTKFDFDDERYVDDRDGLITRIHQIGNVLKVYQERGVTSFYLKSVYSTDPNGNEITAFSSTVMSDGRKSDSEYGCSYFTSYVRSPNNSYFFDINKGCVIKDTPGGMFSINGDMDYFFKNKTKAILEEGGGIDVLGGWDDENSMYVISFIERGDPGSSLNETLGYSEEGNYWVSFYSYLPEYYGRIKGAYFVTFKNGSGYLHNVNDTVNNFYSSQYSSIVWVHATEGATELKLYNSIEIGSTGQWSAPTNGDIKIEKPIEMSSRLKAGRFDIQEGIYRSDFLRDMNTTGTANMNSLFNGRNLRGNEMTIKLTNTDTEQAELNYVIVRSELSK